MYKYTKSFRIYGHYLSGSGHVRKNIYQQVFLGIDLITNEGRHVINSFLFPLAIPSL